MCFHKKAPFPSQSGRVICHVSPSVVSMFLSPVHMTVYTQNTVPGNLMTFTVRCSGYDALLPRMVGSAQLPNMRVTLSCRDSSKESLFLCSFLCL